MVSDSPTAKPAAPDALDAYRVEGMTCQNCARHTREAAEGVPGVSRATVDLARGRLTLRWETESARNREAVVAAVAKAGFRASKLDPSESGAVADERHPAGHGWRTNVWMGGSVTAILMLAEWVFGAGHWRGYGWLALALALPVQVIAGARFYRGAWAQLRRGAANMDTLVSLGSTAAFAYSLWVVLGFRGGHVYFMESSAILTLISLGHWMEALASERAAGAIRSLMKLAPSSAKRLEEDGTERSVAVSQLLPGDLVVLHAGDHVPLDAEVLNGASAVDEAMLTGEAKPVEKVVGSKVYAGTVNLEGRLVAKIESTGETTVLARIVAAVERAQNSRAGIQRLADKVSAVFVPVVVFLAVVTAVVWGTTPEWAGSVHAWLGQWLWSVHLPETVVARAVIHATSVLIVACPCAMGLATPAAIMAGANAAAMKGILIRDGVALEKAGRINTVVFDKTGTLTLGGLRVHATYDLRPESERGEPLGQIAAGVARGSRHPVARALAGEGSEVDEGERTVGRRPTSGTGFGLGRVSSATGPGMFGAAAGGGSGWTFRRDLAFLPRGRKVGRWMDWREYRGRGVEARRTGEETVVYRLGSFAWLEESGVREASAASEAPVPSGMLVTRVGLSAGSRLLGVFELKDEIRPESKGVVEALHAEGHRIHILSGDGWLAAESVARELGIPTDHVMASVKPEEKAKAIERLQGDGRRVAFVGDGLNDGPALARADLGIAVSRATDVARESADIVLMKPGLEHVVEAMGLARASLRTIRQNLFWAFFYNAAAVPLAMLGFFTPVVSAVAMGLSDLLVVGNALRLRNWVGRRSGVREKPANS